MLSHSVFVAVVIAVAKFNVDCVVAVSLAQRWTRHCFSISSCSFYVLLLLLFCFSFSLPPHQVVIDCFLFFLFPWFAVVVGLLLPYKVNRKRLMVEISERIYTHKHAYITTTAITAIDTLENLLAWAAISACSSFIATCVAVLFLFWSTLERKTKRKY